jgi:amino acid permease
MDVSETTPLQAMASSEPKIYGDTSDRINFAEKHLDHVPMDAPNSESEGTKSFTEVVLMLFKASFGIGALGMPYAFRQGGMVNGVIVTIVVTAIVTYCMLLTQRVVHILRAQGAHVDTLTQMGKAIWGGKGEVAVSATLLSCQVGTMIAYFIFAATALSGVVLPVFDPRVDVPMSERNDLYLLIMLLLVPAVVFSTELRNWNVLANFTLIAFGLMMCAILELFAYGLTTVSARRPCVRLYVEPFQMTS